MNCHLYYLYFKAFNKINTFIFLSDVHNECLKEMEFYFRYVIKLLSSFFVELLINKRHSLGTQDIQNALNKPHIVTLIKSIFFSEESSKCLMSISICKFHCFKREFKSSSLLFGKFKSLIEAIKSSEVRKWSFGSSWNSTNFIFNIFI